MRIVFPLIPVLLRVGAALPGIVKKVGAEVLDAKKDGSPGNERVTAEEVTVIVGNVFERLAAAVLPLVAKANGVSLEDGA